MVAAVVTGATAGHSVLMVALTLKMANCSRTYSQLNSVPEPNLPVLNRRFVAFLKINQILFIIIIIQRNSIKSPINASPCILSDRSSGSLPRMWLK